MNSFQGDPAIFIDENGATLKFTGGQPVMDRGFENAVQISLFTKPGWWGNVLTNEESKKIGSDVEDKAKEPITLSVIDDVKKASDKALKWFKDKGVAETESQVSNPSGNRTDLFVKVQAQGQDIQEIRISKHGENWISQAQNPAHAMR